MFRAAGLAAVLVLAAAGATACDYPGPPPNATEARAEGSGILWAGFSDATDRYRHGVLGDAIEAGALRAGSADAGPCDLSVFLPDDHVFEDVGPRLANLDGDGTHEIIVVETDIARGAALAVYGLRDGALVKLAETPHIGRPFRWLAPLGVADLDGDGRVELAYIDRPHLAKTLRVWRFADGGLAEVASLPGLTNHRIGENFISGGIRDCGAGPEIVTADADWRNVMATVLSKGTLSTRVLSAFNGAVSLRDALDCK